VPLVARPQGEGTTREEGKVVSPPQPGPGSWHGSGLPSVPPAMGGCTERLGAPRGPTPGRGRSAGRGGSLPPPWLAWGPRQGGAPPLPVPRARAAGRRCDDALGVRRLVGGPGGGGPRGEALALDRVVGLLGSSPRGRACRRSGATGRELERGGAPRHPGDEDPGGRGVAQGAAREPGVLQILLQRICDEFVAEVLQGRVEGGLRLGQPGFRRSGLARPRAGDGDATWVRIFFTEATTLLESGTPRLVSLAVASFKASLPRFVSVN
jgi:hypothetical protein